MPHYRPQSSTRAAATSTVIAVMPWKQLPAASPYTDAHPDVNVKWPIKHRGKHLGRLGSATSPIGIIPCGVGHSLPHPWPRPPKYSHHPKYTMKKIRCRSHRRHASPSIQWYQQRPTRNGPCIHFQHAGIPTISGLVCLKLASATPSSPPRRQSIAPGLGPVWFEANRQQFR